MADPTLENLEPALTLDHAVLLPIGAAVGAVVAVVVVPSLLPDLAASVLGDQPKLYWYLSRSSGLVAYVMLWVSATLGLTLTNRFARLWGGGPAVADVHQFASLLALALVVFHVLILLGDGYIGYELGQLLVPFGSTPYEPFWVGLGQLGFYLALPVTFSFYVRRAIGVRAWRLVHYLSFALFVLVVAHGLGAGTDSRAPAMLGLYVVTCCSTVFLATHRALGASRRRAHQPR